MGLGAKSSDSAHRPRSAELFASRSPRNLVGAVADACKNCATMESLSEYELQRLEHMRRNHEELVRLGLATRDEARTLEAVAYKTGWPWDTITVWINMEIQRAAAEGQLGFIGAQADAEG